MPIPAFQVNAFQFFGYQKVKRIPETIDPLSKPATHIEVVIPVQRYAAGDEVYIQIKVRDATQVPELLFNPTTHTKIAIKRPDGTTAQALIAMTNESVGQFSYRFQSSTADQKGGWTTEFEVNNGGSVGRTLPMLAFVLE